MRMPVDNSRKLGNEYLRYEKHSLRKYYYEHDEYMQEFKEERRFKNASYLQVLKLIENGIIDARKLDIK